MSQKESSMKTLKIGDLKIRKPIIQGGMGIGISMSGLASAVANMGGVGIISTVGIGLTDPNARSKGYKSRNIEVIRKEIRKAKEKSNGVLGVNIMSVITDFSDMVKTSIEEGIEIDKWMFNVDIANQLRQLPMEKAIERTKKLRPNLLKDN